MKFADSAAMHPTTKTQYAGNDMNQDVSIHRAKHIEVFYVEVPEIGERVLKILITGDNNSRHEISVFDDPTVNAPGLTRTE